MEQNDHIFGRIGSCGLPLNLRPISGQRFCVQANNQICIDREAILDHGGTLIEPASGWGPLEYQVQLFGASGTGASLADAARQWAKAVRRMNDSTSVAA